MVPHVHGVALLAQYLVNVTCSPGNLPALQTTSDPERFVLHPQPLEYKYSEFERLLLGIAHHIYITKKKGEAFEEVGSCEEGMVHLG
jgi:hypothetical protein